MGDHFDGCTVGDHLLVARWATICWLPHGRPFIGCPMGDHFRLSHGRPLLFPPIGSTFLGCPMGRPCKANSVRKQGRGCPPNPAPAYLAHHPQYTPFHSNSPLLIRTPRSPLKKCPKKLFNQTNLSTIRFRSLWQQNSLEIPPIKIISPIGTYPDFIFRSGG